MEITGEVLINFIKDNFGIDIPQGATFYDCGDLRNIKALREGILVSVKDRKLTAGSGRYVFTLNLANIKVNNESNADYNLAWISAVQAFYSEKERDYVQNILVSRLRELRHEAIEDATKTHKAIRELEDGLKQRNGIREQEKGVISDFLSQYDDQEVEDASQKAEIKPETAVTKKPKHM